MASNASALRRSPDQGATIYLIGCLCIAVLILELEHGIAEILAALHVVEEYIVQSNPCTMMSRFVDILLSEV